jgi:hypothetical protein
VKEDKRITCPATEIEADYHPLGYRIDKGTDPLNRYTRWTIDDNGNWIDGKPVCFHSLPTEGWVRTPPVFSEKLRVYFLCSNALSRQYTPVYFVTMRTCIGNTGHTQDSLISFI